MFLHEGFCTNLTCEFCAQNVSSCLLRQDLHILVVHVLVVRFG